VGGAFRQGDLAAQAADGLGHLGADRPPPRITRRRGTAFMPVTPRFVQTPSSSRKPGTGGTTGSEAGGQDDILAL